MSFGRTMALAPARTPLPTPKPSRKRLFGRRDPVFTNVKQENIRHAAQFTRPSRTCPAAADACLEPPIDPAGKGCAGGERRPPRRHVATRRPSPFRGRQWTLPRLKQRRNIGLRQ